MKKAQEPPLMSNSVYIASPAVFCASGVDCKSLWNTVTTGSIDSAIGAMVQVKSCNSAVYWAARINDNNFKAADKNLMRILKITQLALKQITADIECVVKKYGADRVGLAIGTCDNGTELSLASHKTYFDTGAFPAGYDTAIQGAQYISKWVADYCNIKGPALSFSSACSSSNSALVTAAQLVRCGECDAVLCGGADIASDTTLVGFDSLHAVSKNKTTPMSANRSGITLGEGAALFLVTKEPPCDIFSENSGTQGQSFNAKNPSLAPNLAASYVKLAGYGVSCDAYHATSPSPQGEGAARAMNSAIAMAALDKSAINYVNLHGTGTPANDSAESFAMESVFGAAQPYSSSTKGFTGHTLGAAGAIELVICFLTLTQERGRRYLLPIHKWDDARDTSLPHLKLVGAGDAMDSPVGVAMSNTFGFGGVNVSVILGKAT